MDEWGIKVSPNLGSFSTFVKIMFVSLSYIKRARYQLCGFYYYKHVTLLYMIMTEEVLPTQFCLYLSLLSTMALFYLSLPPILTMTDSFSSFNVHFKSYDPTGAFLPSLIQSVSSSALYQSLYKIICLIFLHCP